MASSDDLRAKLLASRNTRMETVSVDLAGESCEVGVLQPSLAVRKRLLEKLKGHESDIGFVTQSKIQAILECVVDPDTRQRLFTKEDMPGLEAQSLEWIDLLSDKVFAQLFPKNALVCACGSGLKPVDKFCAQCGLAVTPKDPVEVTAKNS